MINRRKRWFCCFDFREVGETKKRSAPLWYFTDSGEYPLLFGWLEIFYKAIFTVLTPQSAIFSHFWGRNIALLELNVYSWPWTMVPNILGIVFWWFSFLGFPSSSSRTQVTAVWSWWPLRCWQWWFVAPSSPKLQTVVTWVLDELERNQKKGKSSKNNSQDDGHLSSGPAEHV